MKNKLIILTLAITFTMLLVEIDTVSVSAITQDEMAAMVKEQCEKNGIDYESLKTTGGTNQSNISDEDQKKADKTVSELNEKNIKEPEVIDKKDVPVITPEPTTIEEVNSTEEVITTEEETTTIIEETSIEETTEEETTTIIEETSIEETTEEETTTEVVEETKNLPKWIIIMIGVVVLAIMGGVVILAKKKHV